MSKGKFGSISRRNTSLWANIGAFIRGSRDAAAKAFDNSFTSFALKKLRGSVPYIQNRVIGAFLFTFGVYSALIAIFKVVFDFGGSYDDIYVSVCAAILAIPLLLSKGTLATMLINSETGRTVSEAVGIRLQVLGAQKSYGRPNIAFLAGMLLGTVTFAVSPLRVVLTVTFFIAVGIIFTYPEASVLLLSVMLPYDNGELFGGIAFVGVIAFAIKAFRGKRSISFHHHRAVAAIFLLVVFFAGVFTGNIKYTVMMLAYFVISASEGLSARAEKAIAAAVASCGCVCAVYLGFMSVSYFGGIKASLGVFAVTNLSLMCVALIPLAVSFAINKTVIPRATAALSLLAMIAFLGICKSYIYLAAAALSIILLLFFYRRRAAYAVFAVLSGAYAVWVWLGGSNRQAINYVLGFLKELGLGENRNLAYLVSGAGLEGGFAGGESFYGAIISKLGVTGLLILISSAVLLFGYILREKNGKGSDRSQSTYMRAWAPACSVLVLLICGLGTNIWAYDNIYVLFWIMMGASSAIAADSEKKALRRQQSAEVEMSASSAEVTIKRIAVQSGK